MRSIWLYSRHRRSTSTFASSNVSNTSLLNTSSRNFPLNDSIYPFSHGLPGSMYSVCTASCSSQLRTLCAVKLKLPYQTWCILVAIGYMSHHLAIPFFVSSEVGRLTIPLPPHIRFPQHVDDLLCGESFTRHVCLPCEYSNGSFLTLKVDPFLGGRSYLLVMRIMSHDLTTTNRIAQFYFPRRMHIPAYDPWFDPLWVLQGLWAVLQLGSSDIAQA